MVSPNRIPPPPLALRRIQYLAMGIVMDSVLVFLFCGTPLSTSPYPQTHRWGRVAGKRMDLGSLPFFNDGAREQASGEAAGVVIEGA